MDVAGKYFSNKLSETIIDAQFKLRKFDDSETLEGHHAFPFSLSLPEWLPDSLQLADGPTKLSVVYYLTAQLDPRLSEDFADQTKNVSLCRDERVIYIYRQEGSNYEMNKIDASKLSTSLSGNVGGMFGIGSGMYYATISIEKNSFHPDEDVQIKFQIDNSQCGKDVKSCKAKLSRWISVYE